MIDSPQPQAEEPVVLYSLPVAEGIRERTRFERATCDRCQGRMLPEGKDGDMACFNCGHVTYAAPPMALIPHGQLRHPSTGGQSLG